MSTKPLLAGFGLVLVLGAAVLGLRSLEKAAGPAAAPRADSSRQAKPADEISAPAPDAAFALHACRVHMQDQAPQLELHFTQPLQAEGGGWASLTVADLGPLQGATPASAAAGATPQGQRVRGYWRQTEDARVLRFAGVQPQRRYRVQAGEGLKSVDGVALPAVANCELATTPTPPAHYFASRGTVLPAGQNGGLPVATVNTPEVDVQFLRVAPAALPRFLERLAGGRNPGAADDEGEGGYDDPGNSLQGRTSGWQLEQWKAYAEPVHLARYRTEGPADQRRNHFLPVEHIAELQQPGVYLAVMNRPGRFDNDYQVTHFYVSDIGLQLQRQSEGLSVFVSSLKSGKALAGVRVELLDAHGRLKVAQDSDADGHARFERPPAEATLALARQGAQLTPLRLREAGLDLSEFDIGGHPSRSVRLFAYAGRDLYRPGEALTLSVLARDADGQPGAAQPLQATLRQPDGRSVSSETWLPDPARPGYLQHALRLSADAPTGTWTLELRHDPASKEPTTAWRFQVEEFLPERMKLALTAPATLAGAFEVQVQGDYLYGAPAAGNRLVVQAASERQREALPRQWPGFVFGDVDDDARRTRQPVADAQLDAQGQAQVSLPLPDRNASPMRVTGSFSLLESGGRPVVRSIERVVWPAPVLLAIRPGFERDVAAESGMARFELIRVDAAGRAQPARGLQLRLLREDRQYHWRFDEQRGWHSGYVDTESLVLERAIDLGASRQSVDLPLSWGRFRIEIEDPETRLKLRYRFYGGWSAQEAERIGSRPDRVKLAWVKGSTGAEAPFKAGHTARLAITPPHEGEALVTVQSGARLLWLKRMTLPAAGSTVDIPLGQGPDWARHDLYATVTALRPGSQGERVTPARAVGLLHLPLDRRERALKLTLTAPAKSEPERRVAVKLKLADATPGERGQAWVTLSAVDVGILAITRYASPDPLDFFFGKQRFAPEWLDMYGRLIEKMDGTPARMRWGGDAANRDTQSLPRKVRLVDLFSGPVAFDAQGEATVALELPDFNGRLRLMAVAGLAGRYGKAEAELTVAAPLVAELSTPRFIAPGDQAQLALDLSNLSGQAQTVSVRLTGAAPLRVGAGPQTVNLAHQQRQVLRWPVEAGAGYGLVPLTLELKARSGLTLRRQSWLQLQPPWAPERDGRRMRVAPGESLALDPAWLARFHPASAQLGVALSDRPPLDVARLVQDLLDYPYGCLEQTVSSAYPLLFVDAEQAKAWGLKLAAPLTEDERRQRVARALGRLAGMQASSGAFTLWGGGSRYEAYLGAYVLGFLQDAQAAGFAPPAGLQQRAIGWLQAELAQAPNRFPALPRELKPGQSSFKERDLELLRDSHRRFAELAHIGYMLAREQKAPLSLLRYLHDKVRDRARSPLPLVHLAAALKLMGDGRRAAEALDDAMRRPYGVLAQRPESVWASEWLGDYGSRLRDLAMAYALLHRHALPHERREQLLEEAAEQLRERRWTSTQERMALLMAARASGGDAAAAGRERNPGWRAQWRVGAATQALEGRETLQRSVSSAELAKGVQLVNSGTQPLFVAVQAAGLPTQAPTPRQDLIEFEREWLHPDGSAWDGRPLKVGETLLVNLKVRSRTPIKEGLIVDAVPAGLEIENLNLSQGALEQMLGPALATPFAMAQADARIRHREYRDDRYVAAAELGPDWVSVQYLLRVVSPGRFTVPAPMAEDMYRPELRGVGRGGPPLTVLEGP